MDHTEDNGSLTQSGRFFLGRARQGDGLLALLQGGRHSVRVFRLESLLDASRVLLRVTAQASSRPVAFFVQCRLVGWMRRKQAYSGA